MPAPTQSVTDVLPQYQDDEDPERDGRELVEAVKRVERMGDADLHLCLGDIWEAIGRLERRMAKYEGKAAA